MTPPRRSTRPRTSRRKLLPVVKLVYLIGVIIVVVFVISNIHLLHNRLFMSTTTSTSNSLSLLLPSTDGTLHHAAHTTVVAPLPLLRVPPINTPTTTIRRPPYFPKYGSCAILLFGLPRAFKEYVLPSMTKNVLIPNAQYGCDYFIHYYKQETEESGRSGQGGKIHSNDILLLSQAISHLSQLYNTDAAEEKVNTENDLGDTSSIDQSLSASSSLFRDLTIRYVFDTNATFWNTRQQEIHKYRSEKNKDGKYKYFPYEEPTYVYPKTLDNIVKQWHSIQAVWDLMETSNYLKKYKRIAMLRNDVMYITPIDIYEIPPVEVPGIDYTKITTTNIKNGTGTGTNTDTVDKKDETTTTQQRYFDYKENRISVVPNFSKYPINDRMIAGPYEAVKIWASQRFTQIEEYATNKNARRGMVMHSETFINASIFQSIKEFKQPKQGQEQQQQYEIREDRWICFLRVRAGDGAIWIEDCDATKSGLGGGYPGGMEVYTNLVEEFILPITKGVGLANCHKRKLKDPLRIIYELVCSSSPSPHPDHRRKKQRKTKPQQPQQQQ